MSNAYAHLLEYERNMPVIDTHEHLENETKHAKWNVLCDYTQHYFVCDMISSGLDPKAIERLNDPGESILDKWTRLEPYWLQCRNTGYGMVLDFAVQALYGVDGVRRDTIEEIELGFQALRAQNGFSHHLLRDRCGIRFCMDNIWRLDADTEDGLYRFVTQIDEWVMINPVGAGLSAEVLDALSTIDRWVDVCLQTLSEDFSARGAVALKCALAYQRRLFFDTPCAADAQAGYEAIRRGTPSPAQRAAAQDYVMHAILTWADARGMIFQVHTGYQEGNANLLANSDPVQLNNLMLLYPHIRFDLFHIGFPYQHVVGALTKMFPNVRADMCWTNMLSPVAARRALEEWLYTVPINKIFAFGGDCRFFDGTVGHLELARRNIAMVLGEAVDNGSFTLKRAEQVARMLFYDNPHDFYQLGD